MGRVKPADVCSPYRVFGLFISVFARDPLSAYIQSHEERALKQGFESPVSHTQNDAIPLIFRSKNGERTDLLTHKQGYGSPGKSFVQTRYLHARRMVGTEEPGDKPLRAAVAS